MNNMIGFEGLGIEPVSIDRVAIQNIFGLNFDIYWYAIIITLGVCLAIVYAMARAKSFDWTADHVVDAAIFGVPIAIICSRIYYIIFSLDKFDTIGEMLNFRNGGLAIYGAIIGAFGTAAVFCKIKKLNILAFFDMMSFSFLIGQLIGRWGNFFNAEAHGGLTSLPWGMTIDGAGPFHPTFLYESIWNLLGFILLHIYMKKFKKYHGELFLCYMAWYGLGRGFIEGLRTDSLYLFNIRISQLLGFIFLIAAIVLLILLRKGLLERFLENRRERKKIENVYSPIFSKLSPEEDAEMVKNKKISLDEKNSDDEIIVVEENTENVEKDGGK